MMKQPKTKFLAVRCAKCKNEQIVYDTASSVVNCLVCSAVMVQPTGGKSKIEARVLEVLK